MTMVVSVSPVVSDISIRCRTSPVGIKIARLLRLFYAVLWNLSTDPTALMPSTH